MHYVVKFLKTSCNLCFSMVLPPNDRQGETKIEVEIVDKKKEANENPHCITALLYYCITALLHYCITVLLY